MAHSFDIPFNGTAADTLAKAKQALEKGNGKMTGTDTSGSFSVPAGISKVKGTYTVEQNKLKITITDKPIYVSAKLIESLLKEHVD
jgi:hypothetical protein